jgi:hypothetical protein
VHIISRTNRSTELHNTQQYTVKEKGGKYNRKPYPIPNGLRNPYRNLKLETLKIMPRNLNAIAIVRS